MGSNKGSSDNINLDLTVLLKSSMRILQMRPYESSHEGDETLILLTMLFQGDGGENICSCAICRRFSLSTFLFCVNPPALESAADSFLNLIGSSAELTSKAELTSPAHKLALIITLKCLFTKAAPWLPHQPLERGHLWTCVGQV